MIEIHPLAAKQMNADVLKSFPDEGCGFLFGTEQTNGSRMISQILPVNNSKAGDKRRRFEITGRDYMNAELFADKNGLILLGVYHSHPNHPAIPSEVDRQAALPYFSYVIISVMQGVVDHTKSWILNEETQFESEEILFPFI